VIYGEVCLHASTEDIQGLRKKILCTRTDGLSLIIYQCLSRTRGFSVHRFKQTAILSDGLINDISFLDARPTLIRPIQV